MDISPPRLLLSRPYSSLRQDGIEFFELGLHHFDLLDDLFGGLGMLPVGVQEGQKADLYMDGAKAFREIFLE
jgi:hypothetical protein